MAIEKSFTSLDCSSADLLDQLCELGRVSSFTAMDSVLVNVQNAAGAAADAAVSTKIVAERLSREAGAILEVSGVA